MEFNFLNTKNKIYKKYCRILKMLYGPFPLILHLVLRHIIFHCGFFTAMGCVLSAYRSYVTQPKLERSFFVHNDISSNIIFTNKERIYFIDFEQTILENRWFLIDAVGSSLDIDEFFLDNKMLTQYANKSIQIYFPNSKINLNAQIKIALFVWLLRVISFKRYSENKKQIWVNFIKEILSKEKNFNCWFNNNFKIQNENGIIRIDYHRPFIFF